MAKTSSHRPLILTSAPDSDVLAQWNDLLVHATLPTHYVTPDFFSDPFAGRGRRVAVLAMCGERVDAVATGIDDSTAIRCGLSVRPQTAFRRGIDVAAAADALATGLAEVSPTAELIDLHTWEAIDGLGASGYSHEVAGGGDTVVMLDLGKGAEQLFKEFSERRRTDLRKTMKLGLVAVKPLETDAELTDVYRIHCEWTRLKGIAPDTAGAFGKIMASDHRKTFIAIHDDKVIAATFLRFCPGGVVEYAANNSLDEYQKLRPNELLGWRAIEWACSAGFTYFSLGASHPFLARFGGELVASHRYRRDCTRLKVHVNRERLERLAVQTYLSLPKGVRDRVRAIRASR